MFIAQSSFLLFLPPPLSVQDVLSLSYTSVVNYNGTVYETMKIK